MTPAGIETPTFRLVAQNLTTVPQRSPVLHYSMLNPLTPNDPYRGSIAPLTSKVAFYIFIQQI